MRKVAVGLLLALVSVALAPPGAAQSSADLRSVHQRAVLATVRITGPGFSGSGWLLAQRSRPVVVTNKHIAGAARRFRVHFYRGASHREATVEAERFHVAREIDLGVLRLLDDPPESARPVRLRTDTRVVRGERVVLAGNPVAAGGAILPFQTTEGVVTGHIAGRSYDPCGPGRNCIVIDAASFQGSSGGPAFNHEGRIVGMIWGGPLQQGIAATTDGHEIQVGVTATHSAAFSYLIHPATIAAELRTLER